MQINALYGPPPQKKKNHDLASKRVLDFSLKVYGSPKQERNSLPPFNLPGLGSLTWLDRLLYKQDFRGKVCLGAKRQEGGRQKAYQSILGELSLWGSYQPNGKQMKTKCQLAQQIIMKNQVKWNCHFGTRLSEYKIIVIHQLISQL